MSTPEQLAKVMADLQRRRLLIGIPADKNARLGEPIGNALIGYINETGSPARNIPARAHLVRSGYDPAYGARPLKRAIQKEVETPLARMIVANEVRDGSKVVVTERNHGLIFEVESGMRAEAS